MVPPQNPGERGALDEAMVPPRNPGERDAPDEAMVPPWNPGKRGTPNEAMVPPRKPSEQDAPDEAMKPPKVPGGGGQGVFPPWTGCPEGWGSHTKKGGKLGSREAMPAHGNGGIQGRGPSIDTVDSANNKILGKVSNSHLREEGS